MSERSPSVPLQDVVDCFGDLGSDVAGRLRSRGLRVTPARIAVMAVLTNAPSTDQPDGVPPWPRPEGPEAVPGHLSVHGVQRVVTERDIHLDVATVYRAATTLKDLGLIHCVAVHDRATLYGLNTPPHHHAVCGTCGSLRSLPADDLRQAVVGAARLAQFSVPESGALTLHGVCRHCRSAREAS